MVTAKPLIDHSNVKEQVTATADQGFGAHERLKLMHTSTTYAAMEPKFWVMHSSGN